MKTILVIYSNNKITSKKELRTIKQYAFNTTSEISIGDMLSSREYSSNMQVTNILDKSYKYYNSATGELSDVLTSTAQREIAFLEIRNDESDVIYATKINEE